MKYQFEVTVSPDGKGYVATARSKPNWSLVCRGAVGFDAARELSWNGAAFISATSK